MGFISHHLLFIAYRGGDTHTYMHTNTHTDNPQRINFKKPGGH